MNYQEYKPSPHLESLVKCYWTLEVPAATSPQKQRIVPDGCLEMIFILGEDIKRYTSETAFIIQPRMFVLGQITQSFTVEPTGYVNSFGVRFYPYGLANFISTPLNSLANKETPLLALFDATQVQELSHEIIHASNAQARINAVEQFLGKLDNEESIDGLVKDVIDMILSSKGTTSIKSGLKSDITKRRQLERKFLKQIGMSPKQLSKVVRLQAALQMMLKSHPDSLSTIAYGSDYYDQAHFIKDFKEFTDITPKEFFTDEEMRLSSLFYK